MKSSGATFLYFVFLCGVKGSHEGEYGMGSRERTLRSSDEIGATGYSTCMNVPPRMVHDETGVATYAHHGKMASVYDAPIDGPFRCDLEQPSDGFYVAFWTQFQAGIVPQAPPLNCGQRILFTNPELNRSQEALVIDRCASCVGVGYQTNDPTTLDSVVNGATVDLSRELWNFLYDNAAGGIYDIEYEGQPHGGWNTQPAALISPAC